MKASSAESQKNYKYLNRIENIIQTHTFIGININIVMTVSLIIISVSYTHLDVYKRQITNSME